MSRYLVAGATGFIGSRLCAYLESLGHEVWALSRHYQPGPWQNFFCCDLGEGELPKGIMEGVDGIFHLANIAHARLDPASVFCYQQVNVQGTELLLRAAALNGVRRFVYFSSVRAVQRPVSHCVDEAWDKMPDDPYGVSKREAERKVLAFGEAEKAHVCNLRPALTYGAGVKGNLDQMIRGIKRGLFPPLPDFGNLLSMISVKDLVEAALQAMIDPAANGKSYFVTDGEAYSPRKLYLGISGELGKKIPSWHIPVSCLRLGAWAGDRLGGLFRRDFPFNSEVLYRLSTFDCYCSDRIRQDLCWKPERNFYDEISSMLEAQDH